MTKEDLDKLLEHVRRPMYKIERDLGMPMNTLQRAVKGTAKFPKKWIVDLKEYVKTGGWIMANKKDGNKTSVTDLNKPSNGTTQKVDPPPTTNTTIDTKSEKGLTPFQIYQRKKLGLK